MASATFSPNRDFRRKSVMRIFKALLPVLLLSQLMLAQTAALHGIDVTDLDRKVDPCTDFYEFANGTWRANHTIPATMVRWSKRWESGETTKDKLKEVLEAAERDQAAAKGSTDQIIGDYYDACMDESKVNAHGIEPLKKWFAAIDAVKDNGGLPMMADTDSGG
jgi:putative endopeptidase